MENKAGCPTYYPMPKYNLLGGSLKPSLEMRFGTVTPTPSAEPWWKWIGCINFGDPTI